jgi:hypothetical protein
VRSTCSKLHMRQIPGKIAAKLPHASGPAVDSAGLKRRQYPEIAENRDASERPEWVSWQTIPKPMGMSGRLYRRREF